MSKNQLQRRIDNLVARASQAEDEVERLGTEVAELNELLMRYESTLSRYRLELRRMKHVG